MGRPSKPNVHRTTFNLDQDLISDVKKVLGRKDGRKETMTDAVEEGLRIVYRRRSRKAP